VNYSRWRRVHLAASWTVVLFAVLHASLTPVIYDEWSPDAVWFLGTGIGLLIAAAFNLAHIGIEPCTQPTAKLVRWTNYLVVAFGIAAILAVPEPQTFVVLLALVLQAVACRFTLGGAARF
jgi:hypothetical protein